MIGEAVEATPNLSRAAANAHYISAMLAELHELASSDDLGMLAYLIDIARQEADGAAGRAAPLDTPPTGSAQDQENMVHEHTIDWWREQLDLLSGPSE